MKKKWILFFILVFVAGLGLAEVALYTDRRAEGESLTIAASFYPMYIAALNVAGGVPGVEIKNLAGNQTGCLHDYQLTTRDMSILERADVFVINGGGMENYLDSILPNYQGLVVLDAGEGLAFLSGEEEEESHEEHEHETNAHVWMNPENYKKQIETIRDGLIKLDGEHADAYREHAQRYLEELELLEEKMRKTKESLSFGNVISFHDAFAYLADYMEIPVAKELESAHMDGQSGFTTGQLADILHTIREKDVKVLFAEKQYNNQIVYSIAKEAGAQVFILDSLVTGPMEPDAYLKGMEQNLKTLEEAGKAYE